MFWAIFLFGFMFMLLNEFEDECIVGNWKGKLSKFNSKESWKNKWALDKQKNPLPYISKWYHFGISLPYEERFPFSSTFLVFLTDAEHLFQMGKILCVSIGFGIIQPIFGIAFFLGHLGVGIAKETILKGIIKG
jgi:hypothetical protein